MYRFTATLAVALLLATGLASSAEAHTGSGGKVSIDQYNGMAPVTPSAVLVLIPQLPSKNSGYDDDIRKGLASIGDLSVGLSSSTQGSYEGSQALLDISQGTRVSRSTYDPKDTPPVTLDYSRILGTPFLRGWPAIVDRADSAPQTVVPGLLASSIPGGAAYIGDRSPHQKTAIPAADEDGHISAVSVSDPSTLVPPSKVASETERLATKQAFVVVKTQPGQAGIRQLRDLVQNRPDEQIVIAMQSPPEGIDLPLLPIGIAGLGDGNSGLTSPTTNLPNVVAGIDIGPTVLDHLGIGIPDDMRGRPIEASGKRDPGALKPFRDRLSTLGGRRIPALEMLFIGWLAIFLVAGAIFGRARVSKPVLRLGGLAILWVPTTILIPAAIGNPPPLAEYILIGWGALLLGFLSDRFLPWPKAPLLPAAIGLTVLTVDLTMGSHLITRSILGPNPGYGSRFYGVGNELKSGLTVIMLAGVAAFLTGRPKSTRSAMIVLGCGLALGIILGSGRLGAGVGAVIIVASATAVAVMMMLPGGLTKKRVAILIAAPVIGLVILAGLDLLTAGGQGHFSHNVLDLTSWDTGSEIVTRRSTLAWQQLNQGNMPIITALCLLAAIYVIRNRDMFHPWDGPIWPAVLMGGLVGGLIGSVTEDSGPMLIVVATITLIGVCCYLLGRPGITAGAESKPAVDEAPSPVTDR